MGGLQVSIVLFLMQVTLMRLTRTRLFTYGVLHCKAEHNYALASALADLPIMVFALTLLVFVFFFISDSFLQSDTRSDTPQCDNSVDDFSVL